MTTTFDAWELRTRFALARLQIPHYTTDPLIEDARAHWESSGRSPDDALGSPADFAAAAAAEQPVGHGSAADRSGSTPAGHLTGAMFALTVLVVPYSLVLALVEGSLSVTLTPARLVGSAVFAVVFITLFGLPESLRAAGHPRLAPWVAVPTLLLMGLAVGAFTVLPHTALIRIPVLALDVVAVVAALLFLGPSKRPDPADTSAPGPHDPDQWFRRLDGLLVGRHDLPPSRAADVVDEARAHLSTADPSTEFGPVEVYAAGLAGNETARQVPRWMGLSRKLVFIGFCLVLARTHISGAVGGHVGRGIVVVAVGVLLLGGLLLIMARRYADRDDRGAPAPPD